jgi:hypothetical protein
MRLGCAANAGQRRPPILAGRVVIDPKPIGRGAPVSAVALWSALSMACCAAALYLAVHHPLWPTAAPALCACWMAALLRWPAVRWVALPACVPLLNFSPWTGWIGVEEFDMAILGAAAAGFAQLTMGHSRAPPTVSRATRMALAGVLALVGLGLWRGIDDAGGLSLGWFQGYTEPLNVWRVGKSFSWALLMLPLLRRDWLADGDSVMRRFACGMLVGAAIVTCAVAWERAAYPGLFEISARYRTTALFWEMHVGGAAIDAYVVLCTPFVAWALWAARSRWQWLAAAGFSLLWAYVCFTTFSRGVYLGVAVGLLVLGMVLPIQGMRARALGRALSMVVGAALLLGLVLEVWGHLAAALALAALALASWWRWRARIGRRHRALALTLLGLALVFEAVVLVGPDSFMRMRVAGSTLDYEGRRTHWLRGVGLLKDREDWLWGLGLGRLPAHYDRHATRGELPGTANWRADDTSAHVLIAGPRTRSRLVGAFGLTQRVAVQPSYRLRLDVRSAGAQVWAAVCESHLLYNRDCQVALVTAPADGAWHTIDVPLAGPPLDVGDWFAPRRAVLTLSVIDVASSAELDNVILETADGRQLLRNGTFADGLARWLPSAQGYYVPWHIDNLYLELLIERGLVGLLATLALLVGCGRAVVRRALRGDGPAAFVAASLAGGCALGLVSSVLDVPRVAWLGAVLVCVAVCGHGGRGPEDAFVRKAPY